MKHLILVLAFLFLLFTIEYCSKSTENAKLPQVNFNQLSESDQVSALKADPDWQIIASNNSTMLEKFVKKSVDIGKFDFTDEVAFLKVVGMDKSTYLSMVIKNKDAANRLIIKYGFSKSSCPTCSAVGTNSAVASLKTFVVRFQKDPTEFQRFRRNSLGMGISDDRFRLCCPVQFYQCLVLCSATIEAFPIYLICAGVCYGASCCS
jgi:hypothetical protein